MIVIRVAVQCSWHFGLLFAKVMMLLLAGCDSCSGMTVVLDVCVICVVRYS